MIMVIDVVQFAPRIGSCCGERCESGRGRIAADVHGFACVVQTACIDIAVGLGREAAVAIAGQVGGETKNHTMQPCVHASKVRADSILVLCCV